MKVGFELSNCRPHGEAFYGPVVELLSKEFGRDFEVFDSGNFEGLARFDGKFDLIVVKGRRAAREIVETCRSTKSFLIDHAPIHSNRAPEGRAHFELFSSPVVKCVYESSGFRPVIKGYCGGYFLTEHLDTSHPDPGSCLVYLIHWKWARANSYDETPFSDEQTIELLNDLSVRFQKVFVVSHVSDEIGNFATRFSSHLARNIYPAGHGREFLNLVCNVDVLVYEYSSVFATALWNPRIPLFQRRPLRPRGPSRPHAAFLHQLMNLTSYGLRDGDLELIREKLQGDPKREARRQIRELLYDPSATPDPAKALIECVHDALRRSGRPATTYLPAQASSAACVRTHT